MIQKVINKLIDNLTEIEKTKSDVDRIYKIHKYWARKPWYVVERYIGQYSKTGDLVLDPFCGSGMTGSESIIQGRNFLGIDLNPMSILISDATMENGVDTKELAAEFSIIEKRCKEQIMNLYEADDLCPECGCKLYEKHIICTGDNAGKARVVCGNCGWKDSSFHNSSLSHLNRHLAEKYWVPDTEMPKKFFKDRFSYKGVSKVVDFFSERSLSALSLILDSIKNCNLKYKKYFLLAFSNTVLHCSKLKSENVRPMSVNNYWIPNEYIDENVWIRFEDRVKNVINSKISFNKRAKNNKLGEYKLIKGSALNKNLYPKADYVFTDPPYGETIQYSELSFVWNAWLEQFYENNEEIIINPVQKKGIKEFSSLLCVSLSNIYDSLKDGGFFTLCFANKEFSVWRDVIDYCKKLGLHLHDIKIFDTYGSPFNKNWSKFSPKTDLYVTFKKSQNSKDETISLKEKIDLPLIVSEIVINFKQRGSKLDVIKMYDITVSLIIWLAFYSNGGYEIDNFSIESFAQEVEKYL